MNRRFSSIFIALILIVQASPGITKTIERLNFQELQGTGLKNTISVNSKAWAGHPALIMFWRSDCAPCLQEMMNLPDLAKAHADLPIMLISLQDAQHTRKHLSAMPLNVHVLVAQNGGKEVLMAFGNNRMLALPYNVMLNSKGTVCEWYYGILPSQKIEEWKKTCV